MENAADRLAPLVLSVQLGTSTEAPKASARAEKPHNSPNSDAREDHRSVVGRSAADTHCGLGLRFARFSANAALSDRTARNTCIFNEEQTRASERNRRCVVDSIRFDSANGEIPKNGAKEKKGPPSVLARFLLLRPRVKTGLGNKGAQQ